MSVRLTFLGAAGTVTGSRFLLDHHGRRVLIDCGLFQGVKRLRLANWGTPPVDPDELDAIVLTHAHIDHSGYLPRMYALGYRGPVHTTDATADLLEILLADAGKLQEEEAEYANRKGYSRHLPALPLFTRDDGVAAARLVRRHRLGDPAGVLPGIEVVYYPAGHILGAASVLLSIQGTPRLLVSGDLGPAHPLMLRPAAVARSAPALLLESTYGNRIRPPDNAAEHLQQVVNAAARRRGVLVVPAFAVGRAQEVLYLLRSLEDAGRIPELPVFLDSPMASEAARVFARHPDEHAATLDDRRGKKSLVPHRFKATETVDESKAINGAGPPHVIVAGSGMATGGRVLHHLRRLLPDPSTTVLLVGYQAAETRGRRLLEGAQFLKMHGEWVPVRAHLEHIDTLSAHADQRDLLRWVRNLPQPPERVFLVHGEPAGLEGLRTALHHELGLSADVAGEGDVVEL